MENFWLLLLVLIVVVVLGYLALGSGSSVGDKVAPVSFEYAPQVEGAGEEDETVIPINYPEE